jgi:ubiquinone/menaquinone biosynthesis C-methylase UbiE
MDKEQEHAKLNARKWDRRAATYDQKRFDYFRVLQKRVIQLMDISPGLHFLDIGCGTSWAVRYVAGRLQDRGEFYGVDISENMIEVAQASSRRYANTHFYRANAEQLPLESDFFECAMCTNSFHHYLNPPRALDEIRRVLATSGRLYIMDLTADGAVTRWIDARARRKEPEHVKFYSSGEYRAMFEAAHLRYLDSQVIAWAMKVHTAEKPSSAS